MRRKMRVRDGKILDKKGSEFLAILISPRTENCSSFCAKYSYNEDKSQTNSCSVSFVVRLVSLPPRNTLQGDGMIFALRPTGV